MRCEISYTNCVKQTLRSRLPHLTLLFCTLHNITHHSHDLLSGATFSRPTVDLCWWQMSLSIQSYLPLSDWTYWTVPDEECRRNVQKIYCCAWSQYCSWCRMELNEWLWQVSGWCGLGCSQCSTEAASQWSDCATELAPLSFTPALGGQQQEHIIPGFSRPHPNTFPFSCCSICLIPLDTHELCVTLHLPFIEFELRRVYYF